MNIGPYVCAAVVIACAVSIGSAGTITVILAMHAGPGQILDRVMGWAKLAIGHTAAHAAQFHVLVGIGEVGLDLFQAASGEERRRATHERNQTAVRQSRADADHVLLGDARR